VEIFSGTFSVISTYDSLHSCDRLPDLCQERKSNDVKEISVDEVLGDLVLDVMTIQVLATPVWGQ
jgi:phosphatidylglycerophosphatase A